jgi:hypothetical protein
MKIAPLPRTSADRPDERERIGMGANIILTPPPRISNRSLSISFRTLIARMI